MSRKYIQISTPSTGKDEWDAVRDPIYSGWLTQGPKVNQFEELFSGYHGAKFGVATTSCTTSLHLILHALGVTSGDEVIVPAFSWIATANVVRYCGATPVFVDIDEKTYNIDPKKINERVTERTKAVIVVHLFGLCADWEEIRKAVPEHVFLVEDAACAAGAKYRDKYAGTLGIAGAFSFHPRKIITTGEGGMVITNDGPLASTMKKLRNHGAEISEEQRHLGSRPYLLPEFNLIGFNYRMTDMQGAVGIEQLKKMKSFITFRAKWAEYYSAKLSNISWLSVPYIPEYASHSWQAYITKVDETLCPTSRNAVMDVLEKLGVATRPATHAITEQRAYEYFGFDASEYPVAKNCQDHTLAIPLHNQMKEQDFDYVVECIENIK